MTDIIKVRVPSINTALYGDVQELHRFTRNMREELTDKWKHLRRLRVPAAIHILASFKTPHTCVDPDNLFVKPFIDSMADAFLWNRQDGFMEVSEVRKRSIVSGAYWVQVRVLIPHECTICHGHKKPCVDGRCTVCGERA